MNFNADVRLDEIETPTTTDGKARAPHFSFPSHPVSTHHPSFHSTEMDSNSSQTYPAEQAQKLPFPNQLPSEFNQNFDPEISSLPSSDWTFSSPTAWTTNQSPFTEFESSVPSPGSSSLYQNSSWNPFDHSFASIQGSINNGAYPMQNPLVERGEEQVPYQNGYNSNLTSMNVERNDHSYVSLSSIDESPYLGYEFEDGEEDAVPRLGMRMSKSISTSNLPSPSRGMQPQPRSRTRQPAWGRPRSQGSSISTSNSTSRSQNHNHNPNPNTSHKRRKSSDASMATASHSRLRSISSNNYRLASSSSDSGTFSTINSNTNSNYGFGSESGPKNKGNHNQVEKQYRNRLNSQFEMLLSTLPRDELPTSSSGSGIVVPDLPRRGSGDGGGEKKGKRDGDGIRRVSKAEVLVLAQKYIRRLEREGGVLEEENAELRDRLREVKRVWVERGGVCMP